jgi:hypothetical protein
MNAGRLEIDIRAGLAQIQQDMQQVRGIVGSAMTDVDRMVGHTKTLLAGLGAGLTGAALISFVRNAVDAADHLGKFSQQTGIAVAELSRLQYAAELSDVDMGSLAKGMKSLSGWMVEAGNSTSKAGSLLAAMGVDITKGPKVALEQIASVFQGLADGELKTTLATELFGKQGMAMIPMLNQGAAGLRKAEEEAARLGLTLSDETAKAAEQFNDNMKALDSSARALGITILNQLGPSMVNITNEMKAALIEGGKLNALLVGFFATIREFAADTPEVERQKQMLAIVKEMTIYETQMAEARIQGQNAEGALTKEAEKRLGVLRQQLHQLQLQQLAANDKPDNFDPRFGGTNYTPASDAQAIRSALARKEVAKAAKEEADADAHLIAYRRELWDISQATNKAMLDGVEVQRAYMAEIAKQTEAEQFANDTRGMTRSQIQALIIARLEERQAVMRSDGAMEQDLQLLQDEINARRTLQGQLLRGDLLDAQAAALREQAELWGHVGDMAGEFANALTHGIGSAFDNLRDQAKRFLAELIAIFAKRWVLQLAAGSIGSSALAATAGQVGQGSIGGAAASWLGSSLFGSAADPAAILASGGAEGLATSGLLGSGGMMSVLGAIPVWGWALAAIGALAYAFRDKGENWQGQLGFGANAHAYTNTGPFGAEGFNFIQGSDSTNRAIQAFFASTGGIDRSLASGLTPEQIATITGNLSGAYGTRNDGQPSTFAFGQGDDTAAQQLTLEYLQKKYGTIFDTIDHTFADFIRGYTGDSQGLLAEIGNFAAVMGALHDSPVPGLNIESLRAMQHEGEKLNDTFNRVTAGWSTYVSLFYSADEQHTLGMSALQHQLDQFNVTLPTTRDGFRHLVETTEVGSPLWEALIGMAQAFSDLVPAADAAAGAVSNTTNALGRGDTNIFGSSGSRYNTPGEGQDTSNSPSQEWIDAWNRQMAQQQDLGGWLSGALSGNLSPLSPAEQLEAARQAWLANPTAANSSAYLDIARQLYGSSSAYGSIFHQVYDTNAGIVGAPDYNTRMEQIQSGVLGESQQQTHTLNLILEGITTTNQILSAGTSAPAAQAVELR